MHGPLQKSRLKSTWTEDGRLERYLREDFALTTMILSSIDEAALALLRALGIKNLLNPYTQALCEMQKAPSPKP